MGRECGVRSDRPSNSGCSPDCRPPRPPGVGIEVGPEDARGRCRQEILVRAANFARSSQVSTRRAASSSTPKHSDTVRPWVNPTNTTHAHVHLDEIDRILARELVADGRATLAHLAATAGLSVSAVQSRVRRLESRGVVSGYSARINPEAVGNMLSAFVAITPLDPSQPDDAPARLEHIAASSRVTRWPARRATPAGPCRVGAGARRLAATDPDRGERADPKHDHLTDFLRRTRLRTVIVTVRWPVDRK